MSCGPKTLSSASRGARFGELPQVAAMAGKFVMLRDRLFDERRLPAGQSPAPVAVPLHRHRKSLIVVDTNGELRDVWVLQIFQPQHVKGVVA